MQALKQETAPAPYQLDGEILNLVDLVVRFADAIKFFVERHQRSIAAEHEVDSRLTFATDSSIGRVQIINADARHRFVFVMS
jgi:hypothetical protein